jgi:hypothetical protein
MDALQREIGSVVEQAVCVGEPAYRTFAAIERLAQAAAGRQTGPGGGALSELDDALDLSTAAFVPRLTESWFC